MADGHRGGMDHWGVDSVDNRGGSQHDSWGWGGDGGGEQAGHNEL